MPAKHIANSRQVLLSPAELAYLYSSLILKPPVRPDGRSGDEFRAMNAETGILSGKSGTVNGSARVCFADGTEAIAGVTLEAQGNRNFNDDSNGNGEEFFDGSWIECVVNISGFRDDDMLSNTLACILKDTLVTCPVLHRALYINSRFHWKLCLDLLVLSTPQAYPLPLLAIAANLALLDCRVPRLISRGEEDLMFHDDWEESTLLYPRIPVTKEPNMTRGSGITNEFNPTLITGQKLSKALTASPSSWRILYPPISLLVGVVGDNFLMDPSREELAVCEADVAIAYAPSITPHEEEAITLFYKSITQSSDDDTGKLESVQTRLKTSSHDTFRIISIRLIDTLSHYTASGLPDSLLSVSANPINITGCLGNAEATSPSKLVKSNVKHTSSSSRVGSSNSTVNTTATTSEWASSAAASSALSADAVAMRESTSRTEVWRPPRGGINRSLFPRLIQHVFYRQDATAYELFQAVRNFAAV